MGTVYRKTEPSPFAHLEGVKVVLRLSDFFGKNPLI